MIIFILIFSLTASALDLRNSRESDNVIDLRLPQNANRYDLARTRFPVAVRGIRTADSSLPDITANCTGLAQPREEFHRLAESLREKDPVFPAETTFALTSEVQRQVEATNACTGSFEALRGTLGGIRTRIDASRERLRAEFSDAVEQAGVVRRGFLDGMKPCQAQLQAPVREAIRRVNRLLEQFTENYSVLSQVLSDHSRELRAAEGRADGGKCNSN